MRQPRSFDEHAALVVEFGNRVLLRLFLQDDSLYRSGRRRSRCSHFAALAND